MRFGLMQQKKGTLGISLGEGILNILFSSSQYKDLRLQKGKVSVKKNKKSIFRKRNVN